MKKITLRVVVQLCVIVILCTPFGRVQAQTPPDLAWARTITNSGHSTAGPLAIDAQNNIYVAGSFNTSITINGTTITHLNPGGGASNYLIKYDPNGNGLWVKKLPFLVSKLVTHGNKLYVVAVYGQDVQHFEGIPVPTPTSSQGAYCLAQINLDGTTQWVRTADFNGLSTGAASSKNITVFSDQNGRVHLVGAFQTAINFHNGFTLVNIENQAGLNAFHAVYDIAGNLLNAHKLGVVNPNYSIYADEYFDMDAQNNLYRYAMRASKFVKYDFQGTIQLEKTFTNTGTGVVEFQSMSADPSGNIFFAGYLYGGSANLDGTQITKYNDPNRADALILKINGSAGTISWFDRYQYSHCDDFKQVVTDAIGNVYVVGSHSVCLGGDVNTLFLKYTNDGVRIWENLIPPGPPPYVGAPAGWVASENLTQAQNGGNIIVSGYFRERAQFDASTSFAGSNTPRAFVVQYGVCDTPQPLINGTTQFCQGDSLQLSVPDVSGYSYLWSNGDTTASINVSIPGEYSVTVAENAECYAVSEIVEVTVAPLPDNNVTLSNGTLTAVSGSTYQWMDCSNNSAISGATGETFTPQQNGSYAVIVTNPQGCTDTSACLTISNVGMEQQESKKISIHPNPATEQVRVTNIPKNSKIVVRDMTGRIIYENAKPKEYETINVLNYRNGVYLVEIITEGSSRMEKVIVNR
jgi:hypothetical protein